MTPWELLATCQGLRIWLADLAARRGRQRRFRAWRGRWRETDYGRCREKAASLGTGRDDDDLTVEVGRNGSSFDIIPDKDSLESSDRDVPALI